MLKDYNVNILYHLGKGNIVEYSLSQLYMGNLEHVSPTQREMARDLHKLDNLGVRLVDFEDGVIVVLNTSKSSMVTLVKERKYDDTLLVKHKE